MKISRRELEDLLYWAEEEELKEEPELEEPEEPECYRRTVEEQHAWHESMKRLVIAGFAGDEDAWSVWSDMWKDEYGCRPRYSDDEIRWMYGLGGA